METISSAKRSEVTATPLVLFDCETREGGTLRWCTHNLAYGGLRYDAAVVRHNFFQMQAGSADGVDGLSRLVLTLTNVDGRMSEVERQAGWKGARLTARLVFFDLVSGAAVTSDQVVFRGIANPPEEMNESAIRLAFSNRLNLQRVALPQIRIQRRCPWSFPRTLDERREALSGDIYSRFHHCGYSADVAGGCGNLSEGQPFTGCNYSRQDCERRGMFDLDSGGRVSRRFGGIEFVPSTIQVRSHGESGSHASAIFDNEAKYNDVVPLLYGTAWFQPPVIFTRNDGNLTHMEVLVGAGEMEQVLKVLVNRVEVPKAVAGADMTATGWFDVISGGGRQGAFNPSFKDATGKPMGDPYGGLTVLGIVVPNRINDATKAPKIEVLAQGLKLDAYDLNGSSVERRFTNNAAWVLLDVLRRSGWALDELDVASFARAAAYCGEQIETRDLEGRATPIDRSTCNLVVSARKSAADIVRGIRTTAGLFLRYDSASRLAVAVESTFAVQQPEKPEGSNASEPFAAGWPAYEFGDGTSGFGDIARRSNGAPSIRFWSKGTADTPNRFHLEFQDEFNEYQQDSLTLVDLDDASWSGQEVTGSVAAVGVSNFHQAARTLRRLLDRSIRGNFFVEFETGLRGIGLMPGDLITLTYLRDGFERQPFRVLRIAPSENYGTSTITAQLHDDRWYSEDALDLISGKRHRGFESGLPRPLRGDIRNADGSTSFSITETEFSNTDGGAGLELAVQFDVPPRPSTAGPPPPLVSLSPDIEMDGGELMAGAVYYYAVSSLSASGDEGALSFLVRAEIPEGSGGASVTLKGLRFSLETSQFRVYRGTNPTQLLLCAEVPHLSDTYTDAGGGAIGGGPPDPNFDHANFYWRFEYLPETSVASATSTFLVSSVPILAEDEYRGRLVRITSGSGAGQERRIIANTNDTITIAQPWVTLPDAASAFVVSDAAWQFGSTAAASPVGFVVPNRGGTTVQVCGRAANVHDQEAAYELSPVTRWRIGGSGQTGDAGVPPEPVFALSTKGQGVVEVSGVAFEHLDNTSGVTAGSLTLHYLDEINPGAEFVLSGALAADTGQLHVSGAGLEAGNVLLCGTELLRVLDEPGPEGAYIVERGAFGSTAATHLDAALLHGVSRRTVVLPFVKDFFGSGASGAFSYPVRIPNVVVVAAELFVTNRRGNSLTHPIEFTGTADGGLRTLSGGQLTLQVGGSLAIQTNAAPPLRVDADASVRDVRAMVGQAAIGLPVVVRVNRNGSEYCRLSIPAGAYVSPPLDGRLLGALHEQDELTLDVISIGQETGTTPGRDLTVMVRL